MKMMLLFKPTEQAAVMDYAAPEPSPWWATACIYKATGYYPQTPRAHSLQIPMSVRWLALANPLD